MVAELFVNDKIRNILQVNNDKRRMIPDSIFVRFYKNGIELHILPIFTKMELLWLQG